MKWLHKTWNLILDVLFPLSQLTDDVELNQTLFCPVCRARLARNVKICHRKAQYKLGAATNYNEESVRKMIWQLKYRGRTGNAIPFANLLIKYLETLNLEFSSYSFIAVPLSPKRLRERGYNQAALIAGVVAERFNLPLIEDALVRIKETPPQAEIKDWDRRKKNIGGCFGVKNPGTIRNKNIILIDDVFTSGATLNEAVHQLKDFGAKRVIGLVVAKAG